MKRAIALILCCVVAGCSQTTGTTTAGSTAAAATPTKPATKGQSKKQRTAAARCQEATQKAMQAQTNAAMLGGALSMVGGFGGFAGRGGAVVAQAASVGGSVMQAKAQNDANKALETDCMS